MVVAIITIVCVVVFLLTLLGVYIYKKVKHLPTGECSTCSFNGKSKLLKEYHKKYGHKPCDKCKNKQ